MVNVVQYIRKPFEVDAVEVTEANMAELAEWCQGTLVEREGEGRNYIKVRVIRALTERQTQAFAGDWVLYAGTGYKVYTSRAFIKTFVKKNAPTQVTIGGGGNGGMGDGSGSAGIAHVSYTPPQ